jgi:UDP-N-acetylmuramoyl-tripeptide--D-alanyl-D-alanine ligase
MLELGETSKAAHRETGLAVARNKIDRLITVGNFSEAMAQGAIEGGMEKEAVSSFKTLEDIDLAHEIQKGDIVLIKGSRGMGMERLIKGT